MESFLSNFFAANEVVLLAIYGQAFFVLGLSVALQWRQESRLELARSVPLLAAFGMLQALAIWGDIFIPLQASFLTGSELALLRLLQLLLMLSAYTCLLHFGMRLNWDNPWTPRVPWLLAGITAVALLIAYGTALPVDAMRLRFEQAARPLFVFSGAILAAWGMRQAARQIESMGLAPHIVGWLRIAGLSFGAYSLFGGLFVPLTESHTRVIDHTFWGLPLALPRLAVIGALAYSMIQALTIFRLELQRAMQEMGRLRALASDRQRIGRELHDGTIQAIYGSGLLLQNAVALMRENPDAAEEMFRTRMSLLDKTIVDVRRYIFELSDGEGQLAETMGLLVSQMRQQSNRVIQYRLEGHLLRYPPEFQNHLLQMAREAITNALKHSHATEIELSLRGEPDALVMMIADNGRGLPAGGAFRPGGRGVPNLRARASLVGGTLRLVSRPGGGLIVEIVIPHRDGRLSTGDLAPENYETFTNPAS